MSSIDEIIKDIETQLKESLKKLDQAIEDFTKYVEELKRKYQLSTTSK